MTKDLTKGSPMKLIISFAVPLLFGFLFQQFYNLVDTMIVGRFLGVDDLAAVGSTGSINFLVIGFCMGVCNGFAIPVSHKFGAGDYVGMRKYVANCAWLGLVFSVVMTVVTAILCRNILVWMKTPANIIDGAYDYIFIIFIGIPTVYLYNIVAGVIRATGDSKTPVVFLVLSSIINIVLDLYFIISLHMGVAGAAWATVISQGVSGVACLVYMVKKVRDPADPQGRMESGRTYDDGAVRHGRSHGITIFHYRHWQRNLTDCSQHLRFCGSCGHDRRWQDRQLLSLSF